MKRIVFVCSGNICRSPMAAAMARQMLEQAQVPSVVISAGTLNIVGQPAAPNAVQAVSEIGIDLQGHRSQGISPRLMQLASTIVVMSPGHEASLLNIDASLAPKIHRMWEYADEPLGEIADPVGLPVDDFRRCRDLLTVCLEKWVDRVKTLG